ncbi:MAG: (p)ppGpp synthetase [Lachnospiraceae bacterium]|jgi:putative GTP pyrophosphokinase|nr:(p)ppGpp synthetase [Lachnospiraceae bacterium]
MNDTEYYKLVRPYEDAMNMLLIRIRVLGHSLYNKEEEQLYHTIQNRIKGKDSIENKLLKKELEPSVKNAKDYLRDIAGIRVICLFLDDIYTLVELLTRQSELVFIKEKDYIKSPKKNGYRSYHLIIGVPVYCADTMEIFPVEVQFRTMEMDLWASMEHRILYKGTTKMESEKVKRELMHYSERLCEVEQYFEMFR